MLEDIKSGSKFVKRLTIKLIGRTVLLPTDEIDWIETHRNYLKVYAGSESHLIGGTMQSLEVKLNPEQFVRVRMFLTRQIWEWISGEDQESSIEPDERRISLKLLSNSICDVIAISVLNFESFCLPAILNEPDKQWTVSANGLRPC
jgi:hypothetical protein